MSMYPTAPGRLNFGGPESETPRILPVRQGSTLSRTFTLVGINLTDHDLRSSVRFDHEDAEPVLYLSTGNGGIQLGLPDKFTLEADAETTAGLRASPGFGERYVYDIELITPGGEVYPLLEGAMYVTAEATKESDP